MSRDWMMGEDGISFPPEQEAVCERIRGLLAVRMKDAPKRYRHSLGVAQTAASLAAVYGVDVFEAYAAGLVHDWDKVLADDELVARAIRYQVPIEARLRSRPASARPPWPPASSRSSFPSFPPGSFRRWRVTPRPPAT